MCHFRNWHTRGQATPTPYPIIKMLRGITLRVPQKAERKPSQHPFQNSFLKDMDDFLFDADSALETLINEGIQDEDEMDFDTWLKSSQDF